MKKTVLLGFALVVGVVGFVACTLDSQGTSNKVAGSTHGGTSQGAGGGSGGGVANGGAGGLSTSSSAGTGGQGGQGGAAICELDPAGNKEVIDCDDVDECDNGVTCPPDADCEVNCVAYDTCRGTIECPPGHTCNVVCDALTACKGLTVHCPAGAVCTLQCADPLGVCAGATLVCDGLNCAAKCSGTKPPDKPSVQCNNAPCLCTSCP